MSFYKLINIDNELELANGVQRSILVLYAIFIFISVTLGFFCVFLPVNASSNVYIAIVAGLAWAVVIFILDKSLFVGGSNIFTSLLRLILAILISSITSFALGVGMQDMQIKEHIVQTTDKDNRELEKTVEAIHQEFAPKLEKLSNQAIEEARTNPSNTAVQEVINERKEELRQERDDKINIARTDIHKAKYNYSFGNKIRVFSNFSSKQLFSGYWKAVFTIEILPMVLHIFYSFYTFFFVERRTK